MLELDFTAYPVLVVDDEQDNLDAFRFAFRKSFRLEYALGGGEALAMLDELDPAVIVSDQRMPRMSGIELLREAVRRRPDTVGILLTAYTDLPVLLEAINSGAVHRYVQKPWDSKELSIVLRQAIERFFTVRESRRLRDQLARYARWLEAEQRDPLDFGELAGESPAMKRAAARIEELSMGSSPVLVVGEVGTEKELFARALHVSSTRDSRPFVTLSCAGLRATAIERELFGWERGAFEGALASKPGRMELAHGGTLVIDEPGALEPSVERRLLRAIDEGRVERLGGSASIPVDVRIVVTSTRSIEAIARDEALRARFGGRGIAVPALRERREDVATMCEELAARLARKNGCATPRWSAEAIAALAAHDWPGNVRELACVVERAVLLSAAAPSLTAAEGAIGAELVTFGPASAARAGAAAARGIDLPSHLDEIERRELVLALERCGGNKAEVARALGIQRTTLYYRLKKLGIEA